MEVTSAAIESYQRDRLDIGKAPATVNREMELLRAAFRHAAKLTPPKFPGHLVPTIPMLEVHNIRTGFFTLAEVKAKYGGRIGVLGGVDMHILAAGTEQAVRAATQEAIEACAPGGGYAFGSGNTIANYIPLNNYFTMLEEAKKVSWAA